MAQSRCPTLPCRRTELRLKPDSSATHADRLVPTEGRSVVGVSRRCLKVGVLSALTPVFMSTSSGQILVTFVIKFSSETEESVRSAASTQLLRSRSWLWPSTQLGVRVQKPGQRPRKRFY
jgi:hypothetical protein